MVPPAPTTTPPPSLITPAQPEAWKPYEVDATKTPEENATLASAHNAKAPAAQFTALDFAKDIKLPEGYKMEDASRDEFMALLNDPNLTRGQFAQKVLDMQIKTLQGLSEEGKASWDATQQEWAGKVQSDPTYGGDKLPKVVEEIGTLIDTYGDDELRGLMDLTGAGNNLAMVRFLHKIAAKLNEAPVPTPPTPVTAQADAARLMFPSMKQ